MGTEFEDQFRHHYFSDVLEEFGGRNCFYDLTSKHACPGVNNQSREAEAQFRRMAGHYQTNSVEELFGKHPKTIYRFAMRNPGLLQQAAWYRLYK